MKRLLKILMYIIIAFFVLMVLVAIFADTDKSPAKPAEKSDATLSQLNSEVGCGSTYSEEKQKDIFETKYKGKQFTWAGEVTGSDNGTVHVKIKPTTIVSDIDIELKNKKDGYDLQENMLIRFSFIMKREGGCFLPFYGKDAVLVKY